MLIKAFPESISVAEWMGTGAEEGSDKGTQGDFGVCNPLDDVHRIGENMVTVRERLHA